MSLIKPLFLLAGGEPRSPESMVPSLTWALRECAGERPRVAYLGTASGDNLFFFKRMQSLLQKAGAGEVFLVPLAKRNANPAAARQALEASDAVFLSGGEVEDGMGWLFRHGLVDFLRQLREEGKLFIGMSAGSIMMGRYWVRWEDPHDDATAELFDCLGFVPTTFDTHAEDEDWKELKAALRLQGPGARGYGIPRGGLVSYDGQGRMTALGKALLCYVNDGGTVRPAEE